MTKRIDMSSQVAIKLAAFSVALGLLFALAWGAGRAWGPAVDEPRTATSSQPRPHTTHTTARTPLHTDTPDQEVAT